MIQIANRQRARRVDTAVLKTLVQWLLAERNLQADLGLHLVSATEMARVHKDFMNIEGSTDVITFDHGSEPPSQIHGEIFISIQDAVEQARQFKTTWQDELARYVIHGILHLLGYDDLQPAPRRKMKREEERLLAAAAKKFPLAQLEKK